MRFLSVLIRVAVIAAVAGVFALLGGPVVASWFVLLMMVSWISHALSLRARILAPMLCGLVAALPWLGFGSGVFVVLGSTTHLSRVESWYGNSPWLLLLMPFYLPFKVFYALAEVVLLLIAEAAGGDFARVIFFSGEGVATVRPFVVFLFWGVLAAVFAVSALQEAFHRRVATISTADPTAETGAEHSGA